MGEGADHQRRLSHPDELPINEPVSFKDIATPGSRLIKRLESDERVAAISSVDWVRTGNTGSATIEMVLVNGSYRAVTISLGDDEPDPERYGLNEGDNGWGLDL
jgi:hypothetical protein